MRSLDRRRELVEALLRAASILLLAWMLWLSLDRGRTYQVTSARSGDLTRALREWTTAGAAPDGIHVVLDSMPAPRERDWLAALHAAGSRVTWTGTLPALGIDAQPVAAPRGGLNVLVAAPKGTTLVLSDAVGVLDSAVAGEGGARFALPGANGALVVQTGGSRARALQPAAARIRRVLVIGEAGWESKFVVAALEEDGWTVDADVRVAPGIGVTQGAIGALDTSRYSAVIALDGAVAPRAARIARYVASGGGLVLAGTAGSVAALASVRAGGIGRVEAAPVVSGSAPTTLKSLSAVPFTALSSDAIVLERRGGAVVAAARRHVAGRVLQIGYDETWRWRMSGGASAAAEHRAWWTRAVASVAYSTPVAASARRAADTTSGFGDGHGLDPAPVARLVDALGAASVGATVVGEPMAASVPPSWLLTLVSLCLLSEWASRRMRGAR